MKIYGIIGTPQQTIINESVQYTPEENENEIEMQTERPSPEHIAAQDGTWVLPEPEQPAEQLHANIDPSILAIAEAVAAQETRLAVLEGGAKA